jgi:hypothetical protein
MGIHVLYIADQGQNNLALYNLNGRTRVGDNIELWLNNSALPASDTSNSETEEDDEMSESASNSPEPTTSPSTAPVLVSISPDYGKWYHFIHFAHTLTFSNGKSYNRSYWFSRPDFTKDDIGKPLSYFKKVVNGK